MVGSIGLLPLTLLLSTHLKTPILSTAYSLAPPFPLMLIFKNLVVTPVTLVYGEI